MAMYNTRRLQNNIDHDSGTSQQADGSCGRLMILYTAPATSPALPQLVSFNSLHLINLFDVEPLTTYDVSSQLFHQPQLLAVPEKKAA